jgi:hypothetical protein
MHYHMQQLRQNKNNSRSTATDVIQQNPDYLSGSSELIAVNGATIPATVSHGDAKIKAYMDKFFINPDGTYSRKTVLNSPSDGKVTQKVNATYIKEWSESIYAMVKCWQNHWNE